MSDESTADQAQASSIWGFYREENHYAYSKTVAKRVMAGERLYQHIMTGKRKEVADTVNQHMNAKFEILTQQNPEQ